MEMCTFTKTTINNLTFYPKSASFPLAELFIVLCIVFSCKASKPLPKDEFFSFLNREIIIAWNEDTLHSCQIAFRGNARFSYTVADASSNLNTATEYFKGTLRVSEDTIYLSYGKGPEPARFERYLILEASGHYLIQPLANSAERMFLRVQRSPLHQTNEETTPWCVSPRTMALRVQRKVKDIPRLQFLCNGMVRGTTTMALNNCAVVDRVLWQKKCTN